VDAGVSETSETDIDGSLVKEKRPIPNYTKMKNAHINETNWHLIRWSSPP
jgi:hypothetical protein